MMYETHTVQTGRYKFAWLADWWEVGLMGICVGEGGLTLKQFRERSLCTHFILFKAFVYQKKQHTFGAVAYTSELVNTKSSSL